MLNYIWFGLMAIALVVAAINGTADAVTKGAVDSATSAVQIAIGLVGIMTLWLGMMRVAEAAGLVSLVGRALSPLLRWLFPEVPPGHPAAGAIVLALAANMLGLNNAATPLGIKAMEELQTLNPDKETATNSMVTFMALTTSGVQLIPATMIGILAAAGSTTPDGDHRVDDHRHVHRHGCRGDRGQAAAARSIRDLRRRRRRGAIVIRAALDAISLWAIPVLLVGIPLVGIIRKVKVYDVFIEGAKEGFEVAVRIIPFLVGILVAIGMFRGSGAMDLLMALLRPLVAPTGFPAGARAAGHPALADRQRLARIHDRPDQDARPGLADRPHRGNDVRLVRDDVLRARRLLRRRRRPAHASRRAGRAHRGRRRGDRGGGGVRLDVLIVEDGGSFNREDVRTGEGFLFCFNWHMAQEKKPPSSRPPCKFVAFLPSSLLPQVPDSRRELPSSYRRSTEIRARYWPLLSARWSSLTPR